jgi:hypothetical protein
VLRRVPELLSSDSVLTRAEAASLRRKLAASLCSFFAASARLLLSPDHRHSSQPMLDVRAAEMLLSATPSLA